MARLTNSDNRAKKLATVALCLLGAAAILAGCGGIAPTAPDQPTLSAPFERVHDRHADTRHNDRRTHIDTVASGEEESEEFSVAGGDMTIERADGFGESTFLVPEGALANDWVSAHGGEVEITARAFEVLVNGRSATIYDFGPDGLVFKPAAVLTHKSHKPDGAVSFLHWFNERTGKWQRVDRAIVRDGQVQFPIHHFSKYGIS